MRIILNLLQGTDITIQELRLHPLILAHGHLGGVLLRLACVTLNRTRAANKC